VVVGAKRHRVDPKETKNKLLSVSTPPDLLRALDKEAEKGEYPVSRSAVVLTILKAWARDSGYKVK
jgi:hypothetical protein